MQNRKTNYSLIAGVVAIMLIVGYYSYKKDLKARNNGVYTIARVERIGLARSGWRVWLLITHEGEIFLVPDR